MLTGVALLAVTLLAFLAVLFAFRLKSRWRRTCGSALACVEWRDRFQVGRVAR